MSPTRGRARTRWWSGAATTLLLAACLDGPTAPSAPEDLSGPWPTASPASQSIDPDLLNRAVDHAATLSRLRSLVVIRHGFLVLDRYFNGSRADQLDDVRSVTKTVVSTLVGIAIGRGELPGVDAPISDYLDPGHLAGLDPTKQAITVGQLLRMSSGFQWDESTTAGYNAWVAAPDPIQYLLDQPLIATPGTTFRYNTAGIDLVSYLLTRVTGVPLPQYAADHLFGPLGITDVAWELFADGRANGGSGIDLRPLDLAKLGELFLRQGATSAGPVVPPDWVATATAPHYPFWSSSPPLGRQSYGFGWWVNQSGGRTDYFAWGYGGQFVWVSPDLDLVVVVTDSWQGDPDPGLREVNGLGLILDWVVPAVH